MSKQISKKPTIDIEERVKLTLTEMDEIHKRMDDLNQILKNQKNLKKQYGALNIELNQLKHTAQT